MLLECQIVDSSPRDTFIPSKYKDQVLTAIVNLDPNKKVPIVIPTKIIGDWGEYKYINQSEHLGIDSNPFFVEVLWDFYRDKIKLYDILSFDHLELFVNKII